MYFLIKDVSRQAGQKVESMKTVDTVQDVASQLRTLDHTTDAITGKKILSFDHTQANLSEHFEEIEPTLSNNYNNISISPLERQALQDHYHSNDGSKWNYAHVGTHRLRDNRLCRTSISPPMARTGTTAPPLLEPTGASMTLL